jgi:hypothetical protein
VFPSKFGAGSNLELGPVPLALRLLIWIHGTHFNIKDAYIVPVFSPPTLHPTEKVVPTSLENLNLFKKEL